MIQLDEKFAALERQLIEVEARLTLAEVGSPERKALLYEHFGIVYRINYFDADYYHRCYGEHSEQFELDGEIYRDQAVAVYIRRWNGWLAECQIHRFNPRLAKIQHLYPDFYIEWSNAFDMSMERCIGMFATSSEAIAAAEPYLEPRFISHDEGLAFTTKNGIFEWFKRYEYILR